MLTTGDLQAQILQQLQQINTSTRNREKANEDQRYSRTVGTVAKRFEKMSEATDDVTKSLKASEKAYEKATVSYGKAIKDTIQDALLPGSKAIQKATKAWEDSFEKLVDNQSADYKELAKGTRDFIKTNAGATTALKNNLNVYKGFTNALKQMEVIRRKTGAEQYVATEEIEKSVRQLVASMAKLASQGMKLDPKLTADMKMLMGSLRNGKEINVKQFKQIDDAALELGNSLKVTGKVAEDYTTGLAKSITEVRSVLVDGFKKIITNLFTAVTIVGRQGISDLQAQALNSVGNHSYLRAGQLGLSQGELAGYIGQNRTALRVLGGGNAETPIENGQVRAMQSKVTDLFGLTGKEAADVVFKTMNDQMKLGVVPSVKGVSDALEMLKKTSFQTGMSLQEVQEASVAVANSPAFLAMFRSHGYTGQNETIAWLAKIAKNSGYSVEYEKQLVEFNNQSRYQGIAEMVKRDVGLQLTVGEINRNGGVNGKKISNEDERYAQLLADATPVGVTRMWNSGALDKQTVGGVPIKKKFGSDKDLIAYMMQKQEDIRQGANQTIDKSLGNPNMTSGALVRTRMAIFRDLTGSSLFDNNALDQSQGAQANLAARGGLGTDAVLGANERFAANLEQTNSLFSPFGKNMNDLILNMKTWAEGFVKNPAGQSVTAVGGMFKGIASTVGSLWGISLLKKFLPGSLGNILPNIGMGGGGAVGGAVQGAGRVGRFLPWLGRLGAGLGGLGTGAMELGTAAAATAGGGLALAGGTGAALGYGLDTLFPNNPLAKMGHGISDLMSPNTTIPMFDTNAYKNRHGIINGAYPRTPLSPSQSATDTNADIADKPVVPSGDTMGDLLQTMVSQLGKLNDLTGKQLDLTTQTHQEYMDFLAKQSNDAKVKDAIQAGKNAIISGH